MFRAIHALLFALLMATIGACQYAPKVDANGFDCQGSSDCPSGYSCQKTSGQSVGVCCNLPNSLLCFRSRRDAGIDAEMFGVDASGQDTSWSEVALGRDSAGNDDFTAIDASGQDTSWSEVALGRDSAGNDVLAEIGGTAGPIDVGPSRDAKSLPDAPSLAPSDLRVDTTALDGPADAPLLEAGPNVAVDASDVANGSGADLLFVADATRDQSQDTPADASTRRLGVLKSGAGGGTVTSSPSGISCGSTCATDFSQGTVVTLTATPDAISIFAGWSGACSGLGNCVVTLNAAVTVTATFLRAVGGACTSTSDCQAGFTCLDSVCCTQSTCPQCLNCGSSGTCNVVVSNAEDTTGMVCSGATSCNSGGVCKSKNGETCSFASDCVSASASCTDGRCCSQTCGVCQACTGSGGSCVTLANADDPDSCNGVSTCDALGACKKKNGQGCAGATDCASGICSGSNCAATLAQSCSGLASNCGPSGNESCCTALAVPGGSFNRRNNSSYPATISNFVLDKYDVTVGRFRSFVNAGAGTQALPPAAGDGAHPLIPASGWSSGWDTNLPATTAALSAALKCNSAFQTWTDSAGANENLPMNCLDWYEAFAFCAWDGGRVPTQAECNYAGAGGNEQRLYPWGSASPPYDTSLATYYCYYGGTNGCVGVVNIAPVGTRPAGNGKWGHSDLAGNIWEWNLDWYYTPTVPCADCADLTVRYAHVVRSGAFSDGPDTLQTISRDGYPPTTRDYHAGIRCARGGQ
jgi:sulfatase modifying factor 1